jgi:hypothetical protein
MQSRLSASQSPAQLGGTIKVFERFTAGRFEALRQQYAQGDEKREQRFMDELLTPKARQVFGEASTPASAKDGQGKTKYTVGQIIDHGGKKYRVTGGDLNDPDVEPVQ